MMDIGLGNVGNDIDNFICFQKYHLYNMLSCSDNFVLLCEDTTT